MGGCASSGDVTAAKDEVIQAVEDCCAELIAYQEEIAANVGTGLEACCAAWTEAGMGTFDIPGYTETIPCPDGSTVECNVPARTATVDNWAGAMMYSQQIAVDQANSASANYADQYAAWLASYERWQNLQVLPQIIAIAAQLASITRMYELWSDYLEKTNQITCTMADDIFPEVTSDYEANIAGNYSAHVNELSADFSGVLELVNGTLEWQCDKADILCECYFDAGGVDPISGVPIETGYSSIEKLHASNMAQNMANITQIAQCAAQDLKPYIDELKASSEATFDTFRDENFADITAQIMLMVDKAGELCEYLSECGQKLVDNYFDQQSADVNMFLEQQVEDGKACLAMIQESIADADTAMTEQQELYAKYNEEECAVGPAIIEAARTILENGDVAADCYQDARNCAIDFKQRHEDHWAFNEEALAKKIMEMACRMADTLEDQYEFKTDFAEECLEHWQDNYKDCDAELGEGIMQEAKLLYDTRKDTFDQFVTQQEDFYSCWLDHYKPLEHEYSQDLIEKATDRVCLLHEEINELCDEADEYLDCFRRFLQDPEKDTLRKIIQAGITGCEQQIDSYDGLDDMFDKLWERWCEEIHPCDIDDIQQLCGILDKRDLGCEIDDNNQCATDIAEATKECYLSVGLVCEKEYLQEICDLVKYEPEFCDLEDRAVLHVRRQFDVARENMMRSASRFCTGDMSEQLCKLERERVKTESQAIAAANRFEQWWETRECDRRHRYKFDMITAAQALAGISLQSFSQSTQGYDVLLSQLHARLTRSYNYLTNANQAGASAAGSAAQGVSQAISASQTGHFFAEQHLRLKQEANANAQAMLLRSQEQIRIGQNYGRFAIDANAQAEVTARGAVQDGLNAMTHGRQFKQLALSAASAASQDATAAQELGLRHIDSGHFWIQESRAFKDQAWGIYRDSLNMAQQSIAQGHDTLNQALAFERQRDDLIRVCRDNGMQSAAQMIDLMRAGKDGVQAAMQSAENALTRAIDLLRLGQQQDSQWLGGYGNLAALGAPASGAYSNVVNSGHNLMSMSAQMSQVGHSQKAAMCNKICEMVRDRETTRMQQMLGFNSVSAQTGQLAQMFGGGLANSVEGLIGSIQSLTGAPPSILGPQPGGNQTATTTMASPSFGSGFGNFSGIGSGFTTGGS